MSKYEQIGLVVGFLTAFAFLMRVGIFVGPRARYARITGLLLGSTYFVVLFASLWAFTELSLFLGSEPLVYIRPMTSGVAAALLITALLGYLMSDREGASNDQ